MQTEQTGPGVVLQQVPGTTLYRPEQRDPNALLYFVAWKADAAARTIPLKDTWAESGQPLTPGCLLFLNAQPTDPATFEEAVRTILKRLLPEPSTTAVAWAVATPAPTLKTLIKTKLDGANRPRVDGDTRLGVPPGLKSLGFGDGTPVLAAYDAEGTFNGLRFTSPPRASAPAPAAAGVSLPLTGKFVGCVQFEGLTNVPGSSITGDARARKVLVRVSVDPLRPLDPKRTYETFTGEYFILSRDGDGYSISRAT